MIYFSYYFLGVVAKAINVVASETVENKEIIADYKGSKDIVIAKFNDTKIKWMKTFGSVGEDSIVDFFITNEGKYLVKANFAGKTVLKEKDTVYGKDVVVAGNVVLIINSDGIIEKVKV